MPIVVPARASTRLRQGDIVKACPLTVTDHAGGGSPSIVTESFPYLLVLSRDCRAIRDELISVAPLKPFPLPDDGATFEKVRTVLTVSRDGGRNPDLFYIGPVVSDGPRFAADLRTPFVIKIPPEGSQRDSWISSNRLARIDDDFIDHLHSRIFASFARKGFDDHEWLPDADLRLLVIHAESEETALEAEEKAARAEAERENAAGRNDHLVAEAAR